MNGVSLNEQLKETEKILERINKFDNKFVDTFINCSFKENCFFNLSNNGVINFNINGIGKILPKRQIIKLLTGFKPNRVAAINPPLSSKIGIKEIIKITTSLLIPPKISIKNSTKKSIYLILFYI